MHKAEWGRRKAIFQAQGGGGGGCARRGGKNACAGQGLYSSAAVQGMALRVGGRGWPGNGWGRCGTQAGGVPPHGYMPVKECCTACRPGVPPAYVAHLAACRNDV